MKNVKLANESNMFNESLHTLKQKLSAHIRIFKKRLRQSKCILFAVHGNEIR